MRKLVRARKIGENKQFATMLGCHHDHIVIPIRERRRQGTHNTMSLEEMMPAASVALLTIRAFPKTRKTQYVL